MTAASDAFDRLTTAIHDADVAHEAASQEALNAYAAILATVDDLAVDDQAEFVATAVERRGQLDTARFALDDALAAATRRRTEAIATAFAAHTAERIAP